MMRLDELKDVVRESAMGLFVALLIGGGARLLSREVPQADSLVVAVVLGMIIRRAIGERVELYFRMLPGITLAEALFLPLGVLLYGKNLELHVVFHMRKVILAQTALIVLVTFVAMICIGRLRWFGLRANMLACLGFGSAVCGASAIAITAPITECEPDETAAALVDNTIVVSVGLLFLGMLRPYLDPTQYAALAGETLHQTAFVKRALVGLAKETVELGMAVKAFRIALLLLSVPIASRVLRGHVRVPWYVVAFVAIGVIFSFWKVPSAVTTAVGEVQGVALPTALATIGLRADLRIVSARLVKPLVLVSLVFLIEVGLFMLTRTLVIQT